MAAVVKNPPANAYDIRDASWIAGGGNANSLQYSCLENPWTEEPGGLQSMGSQRAHTHTLSLRRKISHWLL